MSGLARTNRDLAISTRKIKDRKATDSKASGEQGKMRLGPLRRRSNGRRHGQKFGGLRVRGEWRQESGWAAEEAC